MFLARWFINIEYLFAHGAIVNNELATASEQVPINMLIRRRKNNNLNEKEQKFWVVKQHRSRK
jgi:hypothetical protein